MKRNITKNAENCAALAVIRSMHKNGFYNYRISTTAADTINAIYIDASLDDIPETTRLLIEDMTFETEIVTDTETNNITALINDCVCFIVVTAFL